MSSLVLESSLSQEDLLRRKRYYESRNLYNKYSEKELENFLNVDLYEALDLDAFKFKPVPADILKYAVKRKSIMYHPTNNGGKGAAFIIIRRANDLFANKYHKSVYDSHIFDESIPDDGEYSLEEFFAEFSPIFERNGLFSEIQPVPKLEGSVDEFYRFWNNFKTTRVYDEPAEVFFQSNFSRKYYVDSNKDKLQKRKAADLHRIKDLVMLAFRIDPRIIRSKRSESIAPWNDTEIKSLMKFSMLIGKSKNKYADIASKLNAIYANKRTPEEIRRKIDAFKKK